MIDLEKITDKSDHDLLIVTITLLSAFEKQFTNQVAVFEKQFTNHLAHHEVGAAHRRNRELIYLTVGLGAIVTAMFSVLALFSS